jgi:hypothetical protein
MEASATTLEKSLEAFFLIIHLFTYACSVWVIIPPARLPYPLPFSLAHFQAGPVLSLSVILLKKRHKPNKEDKAFLLVELRIAILKYS